MTKMKAFDKSALRVSTDNRLTLNYVVFKVAWDKINAFQNLQDTIMLYCT